VGEESLVLPRCHPAEHRQFAIAANQALGGALFEQRTYPRSHHDHIAFRIASNIPLIA
jgi:hypothetical protein